MPWVETPGSVADLEWVVVLDPSEVAEGRTELDLNVGPIRIPQDGIDWGDAAIQQFMADQQWGASAVDYRVPNRMVHIPLVLGGDGDQAAFDNARTQLQQKVGLLQRERGWLKRATTARTVFADIVDATLTHPDRYGATGSVEPDVVLVLECLPDFYGAEITLDSFTATICGVSVLEEGGSPAVIWGDYPGRVRVIVTDTSGNDQDGLIWGFRSRHYDSAATAKLVYEAEALTPLSGATVVTLAGASGGSVVEHATLPAGSWVSILSTDLVDSLTHKGSYRVWARCYSADALPRFRLLWGVGGVASPVTGDPATLPGSGAFHLVDLGVIRLDAPPVGAYGWKGVVQANVESDNDPAAVDLLLFQPLDESAGALAASLAPPPAAIGRTLNAGHGSDNAISGSVAWTNPGNVAVTGQAADVPLDGSITQLSHALIADTFRFSIPSTATIVGIEATVDRLPYGLAPNKIVTQAVNLVKAGVIQPVSRAELSDSWPYARQAKTWGGSSDLWGGTWTPANINNAGFGVALQVYALGTGIVTALVYSATIAIYYTLPDGLTVVNDTVISQSASCELRTEGMFRPDPGTATWGPVSRIIGDLPRIPPSGVEQRPVELLVKPSRGDLDTVGDTGLDSFTVQVKYRPAYLFRN